MFWVETAQYCNPGCSSRTDSLGTDSRPVAAIPPVAASSPPQPTTPPPTAQLERTLAPEEPPRKWAGMEQKPTHTQEIQLRNTFENGEATSRVDVEREERNRPTRRGTDQHAISRLRLFHKSNVLEAWPAAGATFCCENPILNMLAES